MCFSSTFTDEGNGTVTEVASVMLGIGTTLACSHCRGSLPERLNSLVIIGVMEAAVYFSKFDDILSGPLVLVTSSVPRRWKTILCT